MSDDIFVDYRQARSLELAFNNAKKQEKREKDIKSKLKIWNSFILDNQKRFSAMASTHDVRFIVQARKRASELNERIAREKNKKHKKSFLSRLFSGTKASNSALEKKCVEFNTSVDELYIGRFYGNEKPVKLVDIDYDFVTFSLIFNAIDGNRNIAAQVQLKALDENGVLLGATKENFVIPKFQGKQLKRIYVPQAASTAPKYEIRIQYN